MASRLNFYPSLRAQMGDWDYYITRMRMADVAHEVEFASEFGAQEDQVDMLANARQRALAKSRVRGQMVEFLQRDQRFFSSLVIAAINGRPTFIPVKIHASGNAADVFVDSDVDESFGLLRLDSSRKMYALDGQHRLAAIKSMLDSDFRRKMGVRDDIEVPEGFDEEDLSVIMIVPRIDQSAEKFLQAYRRLFSSLNRHAKKTDKDTNIIIDEDDVYAILTRRLISEHEFFQSHGNKEGHSEQVKMKGRNLQKKDTHFTSLQTLYDMNKILLLSEERKFDRNWVVKENSPRPKDEELEDLYKEITGYWDSIIEAIPELREDTAKMRWIENHLCFRPIGQEVMAKLVRELLDRKFHGKKTNASVMKKGLSDAFKGINWNLLADPWVRVLVVPDASAVSGYTMRSGERAKSIEFATQVGLQMMGVGEIGEMELKEAWGKIVNPRPEDPDSYWEGHVSQFFRTKKRS